MSIRRRVKNAIRALLKTKDSSSNPSPADVKPQWCFPPENSSPSDFSIQVIAKLEDIQGFFNEDDCMHFYLILQMQSLLGMTGDIFEIGSYFGRSTALLARCLAENERLVVCDAFESDTTDHYSDRPSVSDLKGNIRALNPDFDFSRLDIHSCYSNELALSSKATFRFAHVDGGHDAETAYGDIKYTAIRLMKNGIIAVDDYEHPDWSGVTIAVDRFLSEYEKEFSVFADMNRHVAKGRKLYLIRVE